MIAREQADKIKAMIGSHKAIIILGARQVGKSTLMHELFGDEQKALWLNGDDIDVQQLFTSMTSTRLKAIIGNNRFVLIDEAQRIPDIGLRMKLITDQMPDVQLVASGSSSFQLASKVNESLTGRKREFTLFPITFHEMTEHTSLIEELRMLPHRLVYGYYPEVVTSPGSEQEVLRELSNSYLYKDILALDSINKADKLARLVQALALQIGSLVSYNELGQLVGMDSKTVERYIDILEKSFIVFRLGTFSRNMRTELKNSRKIYFWDLGIRNAVIANFQQIENRTDVGALWENFAISERLKHLNAQGRMVHSTFWRTQQQKEIDLIEDSDGQLSAYEFKWNPMKAGVKVPEAFSKAYPEATFRVITPENIEEFISSQR